MVQGSGVWGLGFGFQVWVSGGIGGILRGGLGFRKLDWV